jgi:hypothetical protein
MPDFATQSLPENALLPYWEDPPAPTPGICSGADTIRPVPRQPPGITALPTQTLASISQCPIQFSTQTLPAANSGMQQQRLRGTQPLPRTNIWSQVTTVNLDDLLDQL